MSKDLKTVSKQDLSGKSIASDEKVSAKASEVKHVWWVREASRSMELWRYE